MPRYHDYSRGALVRLAGSAHIQVETIPQSLALKFGLGRRRA